MNPQCHFLYHLGIFTVFQNQCPRQWRAIIHFEQRQDQRELLGKLTSYLGKYWQTHPKDL